MGFFFQGGPKQGRVARGVPDISTLHKFECKVCPLNEARHNKHPHMEPTGTDRPVYYVLGEAPGEEEDAKDEQFVGRSGQLLRKHIPDRVEDLIRFNNTVRTRPPHNRTPEWIEIECCRPSIIRDIEKTKPRYVLAVGKIALNWIQGISDELGIKDWRGRWFPTKIGNHLCWGFAVLHPSGLLRMRGPNDRPTEAERVFERDLKRFFLEPPEDRPVIERIEDVRNGTTIILGDKGDKDLDLIAQELHNFERAMEVAIDIETASDEEGKRKLRPYGKNARILTVALGTYDHTVAFPLWHREAKWTKAQRAELIEMLIDFLLNARGSIIAHKAAFEQEWLGYLLSKELVRGPKWGDTMVQAFTLDERRGALSLDACCRINFGLPLKSLHKLNLEDLDSERLEDVLWYNAADAKYCEWVYRQQTLALVADGQLENYVQQMRRVPTMVLTQMLGINVDQSEVERYHKEIGEQLEAIEREIAEMPEPRDWKQKKGVPFKPSSNKQVIALLMDYCGVKLDSLDSGERNDDGENSQSVGEKILRDLNLPIGNAILKFREYSKLRSTYVEPFRAASNGKHIWPDRDLHTSLNTMVTQTGRLSSDGPNTQNFLKRKHVELRSQVKPRKGRKFAAIDYGQIEARVIGMFSKDKFLVKALWENYDIHTEWAERLLKAYPKFIDRAKHKEDMKDKMKELRQLAKNQMVFPAFFGSMDQSIADDLQIPINKFQPVFKEFWKTFDGVLGWQEDMISFYKKHHYVQMLTGRRRHAPLSRNQIINTPIQGTAADIVIDAMNRLSEYAWKENQPQFQPVLNIHDDLTFEFAEETLEDDLVHAVRYMLDVPFDWVNVPIAVEASIGDDWYHMEEIGKFNSHEVL